MSHTKLPYIFAVGRRKNAVARVRFYPNESPEISVNDQKLESYFPVDYLQKRAFAPLSTLAIAMPGKFSIKVAGGGKAGQADAVRLGIARVFAGMEDSYRKPLKAAGLLTRDPRIKERKKPGLKRARRAPQWQKR